MTFWIYILTSLKTGKFYIGQTNDLKNRIKMHNKGRVKSTKYGVHWQLSYHEKYESRSEAMKREKYLKSLKSNKYIRNLINNK